FGISDDGVTFEVPGHPFEVRAYHFQGRARITVQRLPLSLECARALLNALAHAHNKLEQEIEAATSGGEYPDLGLGV
ncbi:MAG: hypothetical protein SFX73_21980, partial [Kofleriaceae bacterium]|nr:hypothetical protein [Kofleriaceae bacterium]